MPMKTGEGPKVVGKSTTVLTAIHFYLSTGNMCIKYCKLIDQFDLRMVQHWILDSLPHRKILHMYIDAFISVGKYYTCRCNINVD